MSLLEDLKAAEDCRGVWELADVTNSQLIETDFLSHNRWDLTCRSILGRDEEFVAVTYREPCAGGELDEDYFSFVSVTPKKIEVTVYA